MAEIAEYIQSVRHLIRQAGISIQFDENDDSYTDYVRTGLRRYSIDKPRTIVNQITGSSVKYITVNSSNFPNYVDGFSHILRVEAASPTIADDEAPNYIERNDWEIYRDGTNFYMYLVSAEPDASENIRVTYTGLHTINKLDSETSDTVPGQDYEAVVYWACAQACMAFAGKFAATNDPTHGADVVNYRTKSRDWRELAKDYRELYKEWIAEPFKAASEVMDLDFGYGFGNDQVWQTHRSTSRS